MKYLNLLNQSNFWGDVNKAPGKRRSQYITPLLSQSQNANISAVIGVRRSGKSTVLKQVLHQLIKKKNVHPNNTLFVNLEDPRFVSLLIDNKLFELVEEFKQQADLRSRLYIVFDEIQNVQNWEAIVRTLVDQEPQLKIYITGSSAQLLGKELGTKLAGRYLKTEVFPLSFVEFQQFVGKNIQRFVTEGGFPDPILTKNQVLRDQLLKDYFESILLRDISIRYNIRDEFKLRQLTGQLFAAVANQASSYRLSKDLELTADTILQYFSYIEDAYLGFFIPKFSQSVRKQNYNPKKFYSIDNGLQSAISFRVIDDLGKLFENTVFLALRRKYDQIFYWEEEKEVDFIVKEKERIAYLVNASVSISQAQAQDREVTALMAGMHYFQQKESYLVVLKGSSQDIETEVGTIHVVTYPDFEALLAE